MKIMTILGTRPEIIRLSLIISKLDQLCEHVLVHTGQNFAPNLSDVFFDELGIRQPNHFLGVRSKTMGEQIGKIIAGCEQLMLTEKPDRVLILGDTNSALSAIIAKRMGIPVFHMEAGNRCFDDRVPEELNRRIVDHCSDILMPYTERSRDNLLREGIPGYRIYVTGNPILEVIDYYADRIESSKILQQLALHSEEYFLVTLHRAENVDWPDRLDSFIEAFHRLTEKYGIPVICSLHPRTRSQLSKQEKALENGGVRTFEPFGFFDFIHLEKNARCVLTDSGTVQEECCIFKVPNVTLRDVTERPETIEVGSNVLSGADPSRIAACVETVLRYPCEWMPPLEYTVSNVSHTVARIVLGHRWD